MVDLVRYKEDNLCCFSPLGKLNMYTLYFADVADEDAVSVCVLELSLCGLEVRGCCTPLVQAYTGSLSSLQLLLYTPGHSYIELSLLPASYQNSSSPQQSVVGASSHCQERALPFLIHLPCHIGSNFCQ